jgi:hypothetical protein
VLCVPLWSMVVLGRSADLAMGGIVGELSSDISVDCISSGFRSRSYLHTDMGFDVWCKGGILEGVARFRFCGSPSCEHECELELSL